MPLRPTPTKAAPLTPDATFEVQALHPVCGIDEAGRGPLAGPVVAAAVILDLSTVPDGLDDSKALSHAARERLLNILLDCANIGIGIAEPAEIDRDNILAATMTAMRRAAEGLSVLPATALIDGNRAPGLSCAETTIIKGDARSLSIAAASIVAKVTRDRLMVAAHQRFPQYGFDGHKGYGTKTHRAAIAEFGPCPIHRFSFAPMRQGELFWTP